MFYLKHKGLFDTGAVLITKNENGFATHSLQRFISDESLNTIS